MEIRVYEISETAFVPIEIILTATEIMYKENAFSSGLFIIKIPLSDPKSKYLQKGSLVIIDGHFSGIVRDVYKTTEYGRNELTATGADLKGLLENRVILPVDFGGEHETEVAYDETEGDTETIIKHYWHSNIGGGAGVSRQLPFVHIGENQHRGKADDSYKARFEALSTATEALARGGGLAVTAKIDAADLEREIYRFIFDVREPTDRTAIRESDPDGVRKEPTVLSFELQTVLSMSYTDETGGSGNAFYASRTGTKADGNVTASLYCPESGEVSGIARIEKHLSVTAVKPADGVSESEELESQVRRSMVSYEPKTKLTAAIDFTKLTRGIDYDLGDYVTIQNREWEAEEDVQITEIETTAAGGEKRIRVTLGDSGLGILPRMERDILNAAAANTVGAG